MDEQIAIEFGTALPAQSVSVLGAGQRALLRAVKPQVGREPTTQGEADLYGDTLSGIFFDAPLRDAPPVDRIVNKALQTWLRDVPAFADLQATASGNLPAALAASGVMWAAALSDEAVAAAMQKQEEAAEAARIAKEAKMQAEIAEAAAEAAQEGQDEEIANALAEEAADKREAATEAQDKALAALGEADLAGAAVAGDKMSRGKIVNAAGEAKRKAQKIAQVTGGYGLDPSGRTAQLPAAQLADFAKRLDVKAAEIAKIAGRMRNIAFTARANRVTEGMMPSRVDLTDDILDVFPTELALLSKAVGPLAALQAKEYAENGLLGVVRTGEALEAGPFLAAVDASGSMAGRPELIAKGVAMGLAQAARGEDRAYALCQFSTSIDSEVAQADGWAAHLNWAQSFTGGGTSFSAVLEWAIAKIRESDLRENADLLIITDGEAPVYPKFAQAWRDLAAETGARLIFVAVGVNPQRSQLAALADLIVEIGALDDKGGEFIAQQVGAIL